MNPSELRRDPVTGRRVIVAPGRSRRHLRSRPAEPIAGEVCPFCEGREALAGHELLAWRTSGSPDGPGWQVRVVANREPALRVEASRYEAGDGLFRATAGLGAHEVVIESPDHARRLDTMSAEEVWRILWAWRERIRDLRRDQRFESFLVVKNVGAAAGATLDHAHSQILGLPVVPDRLRAEIAGAGAYYTRIDRCVFCDVVEQELARDQRVIASDEASIAFAPFASRVPFEVWVLPRAHEARLEESPDETLRAVAVRLQDTMRRLSEALLAPAYSLIVHTAPVAVEAASFHWHVEIVPRLSAESGVAWDGGVAINPVPPEEAAAVLRNGLV